MSKHAYIIQVTEGWYEDYDNRDILKDVFVDESDAMNFCDRLCAKHIKEEHDFWIEEEGKFDILYQGVWHGSRLTLYESRNKEHFDWKNDPIEIYHWDVIRMNLHN